MKIIRIIDAAPCEVRITVQGGSHGTCTCPCFKCCYCLKGIGLNGPGCRRRYTQCCHCGHRRPEYKMYFDQPYQPHLIFDNPKWVQFGRV